MCTETLSNAMQRALRYSLTVFLTEAGQAFLTSLFGTTAKLPLDKKGHDLQQEKRRVCVCHPERSMNRTLRRRTTTFPLSRDFHFYYNCTSADYKSLRKHRIPFL